MAKKKKKVEVSVEKVALQPIVAEEIFLIDGPVPKLKVWPVAPEFPPEINYYESEKIERFRKEYAAFQKQYKKLVK